MSAGARLHRAGLPEQGEPTLYLSKLHLSEDEEERQCSLVARSQERYGPGLALPHCDLGKTFLSHGNSKALFKRVLAAMIKYVLVENSIETNCFCNRDDTPAGILTPPRDSQDEIRWKAGVPPGCHVPGTVWQHSHVL